MALFPNTVIGIAFGSTGAGSLVANSDFWWPALVTKKVVHCELPTRRPSVVALLKEGLSAILTRGVPASNRVR